MCKYANSQIIFRGVHSYDFWRVRKIAKSDYQRQFTSLHMENTILKLRSFKTCNQFVVIK